MRFLISLVDFPSASAFLCCHHIFDSYVTCLTLHFMCTFIHINFWWIHSLEHSLFWLHSNWFLGYSQVKHPKIKLQHFWKVWIWTFELFLHQINSIYEVPKLKQNFRKRKVVTGKTLFVVIGQFCTPHSICLNIGFWQSSFVRKCYVVNLSTFN